MRGHGLSDATGGAYSIEGLADDAIALMDVLNLERVFYVGLSIGGMIGQSLAFRYPQRFAGMAICSSTSSLRHADPAMWEERINSAVRDGMRGQVEGTIGRWFTESFIRERNDLIEPVRRMIRETSVAGFVGCCHAIKPLHLTDQLEQIRLPVLVMPGENDPGTPPPLSRVIYEAIPGSVLKVIPDASHLSNLQQPEIFNANLRAFLTAI